MVLVFFRVGFLFGGFFDVSFFLLCSLRRVLRCMVCSWGLVARHCRLCLVLLGGLLLLLVFVCTSGKMVGHVKVLCAVFGSWRFCIVFVLWRCIFWAWGATAAALRLA